MNSSILNTWGAHAQENKQTKKPRILVVEELWAVLFDPRLLKENDGI